jgi:hypothetical protein
VPLAVGSNEYDARPRAQSFEVEVVPAVRDSHGRIGLTSAPQAIRRVHRTTPSHWNESTARAGLPARQRLRRTIRPKANRNC